MTEIFINEARTGELVHRFYQTQDSIGREHATELVHKFYQLVDSGEIKTLAGLFTEDAVYRRPGHEPRIGPTGLLHFYGQERAIRQGVHTVRDIVFSAGQVAVFGTFEGVLKTGAPIELSFADHFRLSADGSIAGRDTYFFAPLA